MLAKPLKKLLNYWRVNDLAQLIDTGCVGIKWDEFYLEEVGVIENEMGF